ncbi:MAG TPA: flagellar motor protein MotB [Candidatus Omnitrophota bacterium]|nr:flagellar motor protein MotB [Candidatus Omnitrophota bacterium]HPT06781.1 flagellar motor protein MotB [Candidatus Omnitrophota bacterium]
MKIQAFRFGAIIVIAAFFMSGCTFIFQRGRRSDVEKIEQLSQQLDELTAAKKLLEERLSQEIKDKQVSLKMMEKGLVITFVADVLFDSGKAKVKPESNQILDKVAGVLQTNVPDLSIGIEGHTDNLPIKHSGWKSNWELSTARALSVLHYLVDEKNISPDRVSAVGYGEYRPVATNDTKEGRSDNRRVEIVILPKVTKDAGKTKISEPTENLK